MVTYIEDLVQNIYTNCDMKGLDELNQGLKDAIVYSSTLESNLRHANQAQKQGFDFHARQIEMNKQVYLLRRQQNSLINQENTYRANLAEKQLRWDEARQHRQDRYNKSLNRQNWLLRKAGHFLLGWFSLRTLNNIVQTGSRIQLVRASIEGLTKSTQDWQFIQQQAFKTGTEIEVVAKGYRNFYSSAKMAGFDKNSIQSMYADVLLSTRAIGASTQQTEGALLALEQMISKGTVSMEELRRQLGNAIPGAFEIGAAAMRMTTKEFNEFVRKGQLASAEFVPKFIKQLKDTYADGFKNIEQTVSVAQIRLSTSWKLLTAEIMSGETGKAFAEGLNTLRELLDSPEFKQAVTYLGYIFTWVVKIFSYAIKNLKLVLILFGVRGFYGLLAKNRLLFRVLNMEIGKSIGLLIAMAKAGKFGFGAMSLASKAFMKTLFRVLLPLIAIEDLIFFIGEKLFGWNVNSAIGAALNSITGNSGENMSLGEQISDRIQKMKNPDDFAAQYYKKGSKGYKELKEAIEKQDYTKIHGMIATPTLTPPNGYQQAILQKDEENSLRIDNVNIYTNETDGESVGNGFINGLGNALFGAGFQIGGFVKKVVGRE